MKKVKRVFINVNMRSQHDGLTELAKQNGIHPEKLSTGEYLVFVNTRRTAVKLMTKEKVIAHYKSPQGHVIDLNVIKHIPNAFDGKEINYSKALELAIDQKLKSREERQSLVIL